jgi:WhiB family redox-sensing transcriptional regulator
MADYSRLPGPNADLWDWQLRGLCRGKDSSLFFHPEGERGAARAAREQSAKEICLNCPVQKQCCEHALRVREPYGVWGGMTEEEREAHYQRQKALARARAVREKAALAEKAKLKEKLLRDHERELARRAQQAAASEAMPESAQAQSAAESAPTGVTRVAGTDAVVPALPAAPPKKLPSVAKPVGPRKRAGSSKPGGQNPAAPSKKQRTPANV